MLKIHWMPIILLGTIFVPTLFAADANDSETSATQIFKVTARGPAEKFFLVDEDKSHIDPTNPNLGLGRVAFPNGYFTYRIPLTDVAQCTLNLEVGNRYKISASTDNQNWNVLATTKNVRGLSNYGLFPFDISSLLPADEIYVKFEDSQNEGWGCWLRSMTVMTDRAEVRPVMFLDATGQQPLNFQLVNVVSRGTRSVPPQNPTAVELSLRDSVLKGRIVCSYPAGYQPVSVAKTRDGDVYRDDCVEIFVGRADKPSAYRHFAINSDNVQLDELQTDNTHNWQWESRTQINDTSWTADFSIDLQKTGLDVSPGDALLMCVSRLDGNSGQVCVSSPISEWLHHPHQWIKVKVGDRSDALPSMTYDATEEIIRSTGYAGKENVQFMVMDNQNRTVFADVLPADKAYAHALSFQNPGTYRFFSYNAAGLATVSQCFIEEEVVDRFEAETISPIVYVGEEIKISYSLPVRAQDAQVSLNIQREGQTIQANAHQADGMLHLAGLPVGKYQGLLKIADVDNIDPITISFEVRPNTTTPSKVTISSAGYVKVNDNFFAPLMIHIPQDLADVKEKGFNVIVTGHDYPQQPDWIESNLEVLDAAHKEGLMVLLHLCNLFRLDNEDYESLKLVVSSLKNHPAVFGWFTADEPSGNVFDISKLEKAYRVVKAIDQNHPVVVLDNVPIMLKTYAPYCDILASDPYPVPSSPVAMVADWTDATLQASRNKSIYMVLQGQGPPFYERQPTFAEQKTMLQHALDGGAKSIGWWAHGTLAASDYWDQFAELTSWAEKTIEQAAK